MEDTFGPRHASEVVTLIQLVPGWHDDGQIVVVRHNHYYLPSVFHEGKVCESASITAVLRRYTYMSSNG